MAAVLVHIDLDGDRPHASSLEALAAGRAVASSWGATLYAAVIAHDPDPPAAADASWPGRGSAAGRDGNDGRSDARSDGRSGARSDPRNKARAIEPFRATLARGGADKVVIAWTAAPIVPLWSALGAAWQCVLDQLRPRLVAFGADAPSAIELGPRTAARIGARLFVRTRTARVGSSPAGAPAGTSAGTSAGISAGTSIATSGDDHIEIRDRDGSYVRASDSGAAVVLVGAAPALDPHGDDDIDVLVLATPGGADPRIELVTTAPAELAHTAGTLIAIGDEAARDPEIAQATRRLARVLGAHIVGSAQAAATGLVAAGAVVSRNAPLNPELCIAIGSPAIDLAGSSSLVRIGATGGKGVDYALGGPIAAQLGELVRALEER